MRPTTGGSGKTPSTGLYLDDVLNLHPTEANLYLQQVSLFCTPELLSKACQLCEDLHCVDLLIDLLCTDA